jgi:hypothetical protein
MIYFNYLVSERKAIYLAFRVVERFFTNEKVSNSRILSSHFAVGLKKKMVLSLVLSY